jgi:hypothetical protein
MGMAFCDDDDLMVEVAAMGEFAVSFSPETSPLRIPLS